jgi:hypothetical protein
MKKHPNVPPEVVPAVEKYREFHRYDPKVTGRFPDSFAIPSQIYRAGAAIEVLYRSGKVDPATLRKPRKPVNYIHEHDAGVATYLSEPLEGTPRVDVPRKFREISALVRLGYCLGFAFEDVAGARRECAGVAPLPDLYTTPDGRCLLVIQDKKTVLAMMWGGGLGVYARGIDG